VSVEAKKAAMLRFEMRGNRCFHFIFVAESRLFSSDWGGIESVCQRFYSANPAGI
jgi:hypothetical protein